MTTDLTIILCTMNGGTGSRRDGGSNLCRLFQSLDPGLSSLPMVIIDDGSMDDTPGILEKFAPETATVYRYKMNRGLRDAFNFAVSRTHTKYFLRVDDDILFPAGVTWPDRIVQHFEQHPECGCLGFTQLLHDDRFWCAGIRLLPKYENMKKPIPEGGYRVCHATMGCFSAFRRTAWDLVKGLTCPQFMRAETEDICIRLQRARLQVHCLPDTFHHCHTVHAPRTGQYNTKAAERIREYMTLQYRYHFYEPSSGHQLAFMSEIRDLNCGGVCGTVPL